MKRFMMLLVGLSILALATYLIATTRSQEADQFVVTQGPQNGSHAFNVDVVEGKLVVSPDTLHVKRGDWVIWALRKRGELRLDLCQDEGGPSGSPMAVCGYTGGNRPFILQKVRPNAALGRYKFLAEARVGGETHKVDPDLIVENGGG